MTEHERYVNEINEALKDSKNLNTIKICDTSLLLQKIGLKNKPILYNRSHLIKAIAPFNKLKHQHGISINDIYNLPNYINNPAIILKNYKDINKPILIFDAINSIKAPLFAVLDTTKKGFYKYIELDSNFILSIYGKEDLINYLTIANKNNEIIFYDKKRVQKLETLTTLSLCNCISNLEPNKILQRFNEKVNRKEMKNMSVSKLNNIEYFALAKLFKETDFAKKYNLSEKEIYNICNNLNVLGLCERYTDLFASSWKNKIKNYDEMYDKYIKPEDVPENANISNFNKLKNNLIKKIESGTNKEELNIEDERDYIKYMLSLINLQENPNYYKNDLDYIFNNLHYNSIDNNELLTMMYKETYKDMYNNALAKRKYDRNTREEDIIKYYPLNVNEETLAPKGDISIEKLTKDWLTIPDFNYSYNIHNNTSKNMLDTLSVDEIKTNIYNYIGKNITCHRLANNIEIMKKEPFTYKFIINEIKNTSMKVLDTFEKIIAENNELKEGENRMISPDKELNNLVDDVEKIQNIEKCIDFLIPFIKNHNLYNNFDLKENADNETIKEELYKYYKTDKNIFLGVIADLHNADKLKNITEKEKNLLNRIQNAFENIEKGKDTDYDLKDIFENINIIIKDIEKQDKNKNNLHTDKEIKEKVMENNNQENIVNQETNQNTQTNNNQENVEQEANNKNDLMHIWIPVDNLPLKETKDGQKIIPLKFPVSLPVACQVDDGISAKSPKMITLNLNHYAFSYNPKLIKEVESKGVKYAQVSGDKNFTINCYKAKQEKQADGTYKNVLNEKGEKEYFNAKASVGALLFGVMSAIKNAKEQTQEQSV